MTSIQKLKALGVAKITTDNLSKWIPETITDATGARHLNIEKKWIGGQSMWCVSYLSLVKTFYAISKAETLQEALGNALVWLIEENHVDVQDLK